MSDNKIVLVIGATGGVGGEVARMLLARGWTVRALHRNPQEAASRWRGPAIEWRLGDAMVAADVAAAADGAQWIFHGANPPGYRNWAGLALPMLENTIAAAKASGAKIAFPGTIYNYGPDAWPLISETSPQNPLTRKGKIRVAMEDRLQQASSEGSPVLIVRAGDFFGPNVGNSWFGQGIVKAGTPLKTVTYPGTSDVGHAWAYLPDLAETFARLMERPEALPAFSMFQFRGHFFDRGIDIAKAVRDVAGQPGLKIQSFPWWFIYAASPFVETFREMTEMRYLWTKRLELDNRKLVALLGEEPHTPLPEAIRVTLKGLGCL